MPDAFISYSRKNIAFARLLMEALDQNGIQVWIDWQDIPPSADWLAEVYEAIEQSDAFIFLISENSVVSEICSLEIAHAIRNNKRLIPIIVNEVEPRKVPAPLAALQWIFFNQEDQFSDSISDLIAAMQIDQGWVKDHTRMQNRALEWSRKERPSASLLRGQDLTQAENWLSQAAGKDPNPTPLQTEFIFASRHASDRRQRIGAIAAITGILAAIGLGLWAWSQRTQALQTTQARATAEAEAIFEANTRATAQADAVMEEHARATAQTELDAQYISASARQLAAQAGSYHGYQLDLGLLLSLEALGRQDNLETRRALFDALTDQPYLARFLLRDPHLTSQGFAFDAERNLVVNRRLEQEILVFERQSGALLKQIPSLHEIANLNYYEMHAAPPGIRFSTDGALMLTGGMDRSWILWDAVTYQSIGDPLTDNPNWETILSFSPTFDRLATFDLDAISIWDRESEELLLKLEDLPGAIYGMPIFTEDSTQFIIAFDERIIQIYEIESGELILQLQPAEELGEIKVLAVNAQGTRLGVVGQQMIYLYDLTSGTEVGTYKRNPKSYFDHLDFTYDFFFDPQGQAYVLYNYNHEDLYLERIEEETVLVSRFHHFEDLHGIDFVFNIDPVTLEITTLRSKMIGIELLVYDPLHAFSILEPISFDKNMDGPQRLTRTAFHPSMENIFSSGVCGDSLSFSTCDLTIWDVATDTPSAEQTMEVPWPIRAMAFHPQGELLAVAGGDKSITLWDWEQNEQTALAEGLENTIDDLAFSAGGTYLAARYKDEEIPISVWILDSGEIHAQELWEPSSGAEVKDIAFHPQKPWLAIAYGDHAEIWNIAEQMRVAEISLDEQQLIFDLVAFHPDGNQLATGGKDGFARWDLESLTPLSLPAEEDTTSYEIRSLAYDPSGAWLVTGVISTVRLYDAQNGALIGVLTPFGISPRQDQFHYLLPPVLSFSTSGSRLTAYAQGNELVFWRLDIDAWHAAACKIANRNLTQEEWKTFMGEEEYHETCP